MDLKEKKKMNVKVILCVIAFILIVIALVWAFTQKPEEEMGVVEHTVVEGLYEDAAGDNCTEIVKVTEEEDASNVDDKVLLYLIFGMMKKDKILADTISLNDYKDEALKVVDKDAIPLQFDYIFEGYKYSLKDDEITRSKASCEENYVTKLYGYSGSNELTVYAKAGYVKDDIVYDLSDKKLGAYSEDDINDILDNGTMQVYKYEKVSDNYKLVSVGVK